MNDIPQNLQFKIEGENVDIISNVYIDGIEVPIVSAEPSVIAVNSGEIELAIGQLVTVSFKSLSSNLVPAVEGVEVVAPSVEYKEFAIWDFEDGTYNYSGEPTASVESGGSDCPGNTDKYFKLRSAGYGWDKETGIMVSDELADVSSYVNPYITFAVRTPVGSGGYFQLEDQQGNYRHFDYGFDTNGEWMIVSQPLSENWEGGEFSASVFMPKLSFKAGNAGENQDLDLAYMKITEGEYSGDE